MLRVHRARGSVGFEDSACKQTAHTLAPTYLSRDYFKAKVYILFGYMDP